MQKQLIKSLFKPYEIKNISFLDFLDEKAKRNFFKHRFYFECSKATDESCMNTKCKYNYVNVHNDELYIELMQEIRDEKLAMNERNGGGNVCKNN